MTHVIMFDRPDTNKVEQGLIRIAQPHFKFPLHGRVTVRADVNQFNAKEDVGVWLQAKGKREHIFEAYWDDVWVCDFNTGFSAKQMEVAFLKGFVASYEKGMIHLNTVDKWKEIQDKQNYENIIQEAIKEQKEMAKTTEEDHLSSNVVVELLEEKKEKVKKTKKKMTERYGD